MKNVIISSIILFILIVIFLSSCKGTQAPVIINIPVKEGISETRIDMNQEYYENKEVMTKTKKSEIIPSGGEITIIQPRNNTAVSESEEIIGTYSDGIKGDIWIIVWPEKAPGKGWPQSNDAAEGISALKDNGRWLVNCFFGGPPQRYDIAIYTSTHSASLFLKDKLKKWYKYNDYKGISTLPSGLLERERIQVFKPQRKLYEGDVLFVIQTESEIIVENIYKSAVAIRLSWDNKDPYGTGAGVDSYINNWVPPKKSLKRKFKDHESVQTWAWGSSGALIESCNLMIK